MREEMNMGMNEEQNEETGEELNIEMEDAALYDMLHLQLDHFVEEYGFEPDADTLLYESVYGGIPDLDDDRDILALLIAKQCGEEWDEPEEDDAQREARMKQVEENLQRMLAGREDELPF